MASVMAAGRSANSDGLRADAYPTLYGLGWMAYTPLRSKEQIKRRCQPCPPNL
jgi:hypothetical protein